MKKYWYQSRTVWGSIFLAIEAALLTLPGTWLWPEVIIGALGVFLTISGFRNAMK